MDGGLLYAAGNRAFVSVSRSRAPALSWGFFFQRVLYAATETGFFPERRCRSSAF